MSALLDLQFTGDKYLSAVLRDASRKWPKLFRDVLKEIGERKLAKTKRLVPYKTGKLHDSGRVSVRVGQKQVSLVILYGGPDVPYAVAVHENLEARHRGGRRAKFVESVLLETNLGAEIAAELDLGFGVR